MRVHKTIKGLLLLVVVFALPLLISSIAAAYAGEFGSHTYFNGIKVDKNGRTSAGDYLGWIGDGGYSSSYVMQNHQAPRYAGFSGDTGQGGAVGWLALNNNGSSSAIADNTTRKRKLFELLQRANKGTDSWDKMGSALIVNQMLQKPKNSDGWGVSARTITNAQWDELERRLVDNTEIDMVLVPNYNVMGKKSTTGVTYRGAEDVIDWTIISGSPGTEYVWVFRENGVDKYALEFNCANPIGDIPGFDPIEDDEYTLTPTLNTPANNGTVVRNQQVTASATVVNSGDAAGSKDWYISRYKAGASSGTKTTACVGLPGSECTSVDFSHTFTAGGTPGATRSGSMSALTVPTTAKEGDKYCWVASVSRPTQEATPAWGRSATHCVTVKKEFTLTPSITTIVNKSGGAAIAPNATVSRGATVVIRNRVRNSGPDTSLTARRVVTRIAYRASATPSLAASTSKSIGCDAFPSAGRFNSGALGCSGIRNVPEAALAANTNRDRNTQDEYEIDDAYTVGTKVCFVVSVSRYDESAAASEWKHSPMRCVTVKRDFTLVPTIERVMGGLADESVVVQGDSGTVQYSVENTGQDPSIAAEWRLTYYEYLPASGTTPTTNQKQANSNSTRVPCEAFPGNGRAECLDTPPRGWTSPSAGVIIDSGPSNKVNRETATFTIPANAAVGTKYCWVASVRPPTTDSASTIWSHSAMTCIIVGKKPKIQVWGGDVRSGGNITTSISTIQNRTYGSWVEYAALSRAHNSGFASGAGLNNGNSSSSQSSWAKLTFANTGTAPSCTFGCYNFTLSATALTGQFSSTTQDTELSGTINDLNSTASGSGIHVYRAGDVNLGSTEIDYGKTIVIVASGTVTIQGNITYEDREYNNTRELPQLIIKAPTINIRNAAGEIDAWLLATTDSGSGVLNTCSNVAVTTSLTDSICDNQLTVNGPVVADTIHLRRTAGSETVASRRGEPAEIFNLRADAYLWGSAYGSSTNQIQTVYSKELSPRF